MVRIETEEFGVFEAANIDIAKSRAIKRFAESSMETFDIELITVDGYFLHQTSVKEIQVEIEHEAKGWKKQAEIEMVGYLNSQIEAKE